MYACIYNILINTYTKHVDTYNIHRCVCVFAACKMSMFDTNPAT